MIKTLVFLASAAALVFANEEVIRGIVRLDGNGISGNITFTCAPDDMVRITGRIVGMPAGEYGFHVHNKGDITGGCLSTQGHFNPHGKHHGHPEDEDRHVGDLGNVKFDQSGICEIDFLDRLIKLSGPNNIIGRGVVLHAMADDFGRTDHPDSKTTGNAGARVACGVIGIMETRAASSASTIVGTSIMMLSLINFML